MIKPLVTRFLQHLTNQNEWSRKYLQPFAGKVVRFDFVLAKTDLLILEDGSLALGGETYVPEATVYAPPSLMLGMMAGDESAKTHIKIEGDAHLATEISKVLQHMRWDIEEDLSKVVGDIAAFKIGEISKKTFAEAKKQSINVAEILSEYWQEEKNILAKKRHVEAFNANVDALVSDVARFEKRIQKFQKEKLQKESAN